MRTPASVSVLVLGLRQRLEVLSGACDANKLRREDRRHATWFGAAADVHLDCVAPRPEMLGQQGRHAPRLHDLEEVRDAADGGVAEDELEEDAGATDDEREDHEREVLQ